MASGPGMMSFSSGGGGPEVTPLPFRMLLVADFTGRRLALGEEAPESGPIRLTQETFNQVLADLAPELILEVANHLGGPEKTLVAQLKFSSIDAFRPEAVAAAQPECARTLALREEIVKLGAAGKAPREIAEQLASTLAAVPDGQRLAELLRQAGTAAPAPAPPAAPPSPAAAAADAGGSLLDSLVDATQQKPSPAPGSPSGATAALGAVIGSIGGSKSIPKSSGGVLGPVLDEIDLALGRQLDAILHDPQFRALEEAWRGLRFLVARADARKGIVLEIFHAAKDDLRRLLIEGVLENEWQAPGDPQLSVVIVDHAFDRTPRDITMLQELAQAGERLQAPVLTAAAAEFLGLDSIHGLGAGGSLHDLVSHPEFAKWMGLRQSDPARWLGVTVNRFLLRRPWGDAAQPVKGLNYREACQEGTGAGLLWGSGVWAVGSAIAQSFAREGWPIFISGAREGGLIDDLPLRKWEARKGAAAQISLETGLSDLHAADLATAGLIPLQCAANKDQAYLTYVPTAHLAKRYSDPAATSDAQLKALLPYQLYAARVAAWLNSLMWQGAGDGDSQAVAASLKRRTLDLLHTARGSAPEDSVQVEVADHPENPQRYLVSFVIKPPFKLFNVTPRLELAMPLPKT